MTLQGELLLVISSVISDRLVKPIPVFSIVMLKTTQISFSYMCQNSIMNSNIRVYPCLQRTFLSESNELPDRHGMSLGWVGFPFLFPFPFSFFFFEALSLPISYHWLAKKMALFQSSDLYETKMYSEQTR